MVHAFKDALERELVPDFKQLLCFISSGLVVTHASLQYMKLASKPNLILFSTQINTWMWHAQLHSRSPQILMWSQVYGQRELTWHARDWVSGRMSKCELIELKDLSVHDPIELAAPGPRAAPRQASHFHIVRLVGDTVSIEAPSGDAGAGHDFQPYGHTHLTWCDLCGEFIWGLYKQALRCTSEYSAYRVNMLLLRNKTL